MGDLMFISGRTRVAGIIGHPVAHSLSPTMHNAGFRAANLDWVYVPFPVEPDYLGQALSGLFHAGVAGLNVTVPFKVAVIEHLEGLTTEAMRIGAVNLLTRGRSGWIGDNTDGRGFVQALQEAGFVPEGKSVLLLGAGGAARAVAHSLLLAGVTELTIANRTPERAENLLSELAEYYEEVMLDRVDWAARSNPALLEGFDLIVNATSEGMGAAHGQASVVDLAGLAGENKPLVADIVYVPLETPLIQMAKRQGLPTLTGEKMLLYQGVISWETWTGRPAPVVEMLNAMLTALRA